MKRATLIPVLSSLACLFLGTILAEEPHAPSTLLAQPGKLLAADAFTKDATPLTWKTPNGKWERTSDGLKGEEVPEEKHSAATFNNQHLGDFVASYEFRFDGARCAGFRIFVKGCKVASVQSTTTTFRLEKDPNGKGLGGEGRDVFFTKPIKLKKGTWHGVVLEVVGDTMVATLDGEISAFGTNEIFKAAGKSTCFEVAGHAATFRNFAVWEAKPEPKPDWSVTSVKLAKTMKDSAAAETGAVK